MEAAVAGAPADESRPTLTEMIGASVGPEIETSGSDRTAISLTERTTTGAVE